MTEKVHTITITACSYTEQTDKNEFAFSALMLLVGCWRGYLSGARCRLAFSPADATATHCLLIQKNPDWFYLSGNGSPAYSRTKGC